MQAINRIRVLLPALLLLLGCGCASQQETVRGEALIRDTSGLGKTTTYRLQEIAPAEISHAANLTVSESWQIIKSVRSTGSECRLKELCVTRGQQVQAGDPIAVLQGLGSEADVELKWLEINSFRSRSAEMLAWYEAQIALAESLPESTETELREKELQTEYARLEYRKYQLQMNYSLRSLEDQLESLSAAAGETVITAPVSGSVHSLISRYAPGDLLPANTELCSIYGSEGLRLYGSSGTGTFVYGREVSISMGRGGRSATLTGKVVCSPEVLGGNMPGNMILLEVDVPEEGLPDSEGTATVRYTLLRDVYAVPKNCINTRDGISCVDLLIGDTVCTRNVVRGPGAGSMVSILSGLSEGDQVVVSSYRS